MRVKHWDVELARWSQVRQGAPFAWGETDCALLAFEAWDLQAGTRLAEEYRGRWASELGARRFMIEADTDLKRVLEAQAHERVNPGFQQRGDVLVQRNDWLAGCVCFGMRVLAAPLGSAVGFHPTNDVIAAGCDIYRVA